MCITDLIKLSGGVTMTLFQVGSTKNNRFKVPLFKVIISLRKPYYTWNLWLLTKWNVGERFNVKVFQKSYT